MSMRLGISVLVIVLTSSGCYSMRPLAPVSAKADGVNAQVVAVRLPPSGNLLPGGAESIIVDVSTNTDHTTQVSGAWLAKPEDPLCSGGWRGDVWIDGEYRDVLPPDVHRIQARFSLPRREVRGERFVDVRLLWGTQEQCLRLPLTARKIAYVQRSVSYLTLGAGAESVNVQAEEFLASAALGVGYTQSFWRLEGSLGAGAMSCSEEVCGKEDNKLQDGLAVPVRPALKAYPLAGTADAISGALGLGARYSLIFSQLPTTTDGREQFWAHGVHALLLAGFGDGAFHLKVVRLELLIELVRS